ncbi:MAG: hypothetical protein NVSMB9_21670 [Isosphaeraceae bacterium]
MIDPGTTSPNDAPLASLVHIAIPLCQQAETLLPPPGPGRPVKFPEWAFAVLIFIAVARRLKTKSAQYRYVKLHREEIGSWLGLDQFPARSTYCQRFRKAHRLLAEAIRVHGRHAVDQGWAAAESVAVDRSLVTARGPAWHKRQREAGARPKGVDIESTWSYSKHHGWVQGYSYEVIVSADASGVVWPLVASVDPAHWREARTFPGKVEHLLATTHFVLADSGYDSNDLAETVEGGNTGGEPPGRRFVCPQVVRHNARRPKTRTWRESRRRLLRRQRRQQRRQYYESPEGKAKYARRNKTVEPFNEWFKSLFEFGERVWHRGLANTQTQILAALFVYQVLLHQNHLLGNHNAQIRWILDGL